MSVPATVPATRASASGRLTVIGARGLAWLVCQLPDGAMHRLFAAFGEIHYRFARRRRELARRNLQRVCRALESRGLASARVAVAAHDDHALERLVQQVFRHHGRYYLEVLRVAAYSPAYVATHLRVDDPAEFDAALDTSTHGTLFVGMHFGAMELPVRLAALRRDEAILAPMETLADPALHAWFHAQRSAAGIEPVDPHGAGRRLVERVRAGGVVAIVGDRPIAGPGRPATLFGAQAALPVGPALLALEAGVRAWAVAVRRTGWGQYAVRVEPVAMPAKGAPRARAAAFMAAEAAAFERLVADAPEQWWTLLFPIWEDAA
ncbi:MAG: lysophospholipid acyltransferase family protein [Candidatus Limnocylindrales bacterium]